MILRWQYQSFKNSLHALLSDRPVEAPVVLIAAFLLIACYAADYYSLLVDAGPMIREDWGRVAFAGLAATAVLGGTIGYRLGRWASAKTRTHWISVLPWPDTAKKRCARSAALTLSAGLAPIAALLGCVVTVAVGKPYAVLSGVFMGLAFVVPAALAALVGARDADQTKGSANTALVSARQDWITRLAAAVDRSVPKWVALWAQTDSSRYVSAWWIGSLLIWGGAAGAISIAQWQPWPSVVTAVIGGNMAFIAGLNAKPLLSPVLRSTSVGFGATWMALIRVPAILSLAWFTVAALPALVVSHNSGGEGAGGVLLLVILDLLFCTAVALIPSSRHRAELLYTILLSFIIYQALQYGVAFVGFALVVMLVVVPMLWRRARKRFRSNE